MASQSAQWDTFLRGLTMERFTHLPESTGPVEGPQRDAMIEEARVAAEAARVVRSLEQRRTRITVGEQYEISDERFEREA